MKIILTLLLIVTAFPVSSENKRPIEVKEIDQGVYLHTSFKNIRGYGLVDSNGLIVLDGRQAYIIDTPWSEEDTDALLSWILKKSYDVKASISTHSHEDRTAGIELLNSKSIPTYTSELTRKLLSNTDKPVPTRVFGGDDFSLGNGLIEFYYPGAGHTQDNIVAWLPKSKILFAGCLVRSHEWESLGFVGDASIADWANSIRNIKSKNYDIKTIVPGHGTAGGSDMLDHTIDLAESASDKLKRRTTNITAK